MRKISKGREPDELRVWKRLNPLKIYKDLTRLERDAIKRETLNEQFGLCAYCCKKIDKKNSINEHVEARDLAPNRQLDFENIVASCNTRKRCDNSHRAKALPLTPLMDECETELKFYLSGKADGLTERARQVIDVLGLDSRSIREERKQIIDDLLYPNKSGELFMLDDDLLGILLEDFQKPDDQGLLPPYSPVLINIIRHFLSTRAV